MRKDRAAILQIFAVVNRMNPDTELDKHAGGWRLTTKDGGRNISPRLDTSDFYWWMDGYETGLRKGE
jgi:hypothetical protein